MPQEFTTTVLSNQDLGHGNYRIEFAAPQIPSMDPAQFFMIGIPGAETLLRRPYSVCGLPEPKTFTDTTDGAYQVLYKSVGTGTSLLASLGAGATLSVLGPLGHGFTVPEDPETQPIFVAGGIGSAPFPAMYPALAGKTRKPILIYGARGVGDLPLLDWFREQSTETLVTTDDGSLGVRGRVTVALEEVLSRKDAGPRRLYVCGPDPMLHAVAEIAATHETPCELAMEAHMACGFGVCLGCVVPVHDGQGGVRYDRLCVEGPVMQAETIAW